MSARNVFLGVSMAALLAPGLIWAQAAPPKPQQGMGGIAAGVGAAPVYDAQKRPITAGGFVDSGTVVFKDITKAAGLSGWTQDRKSVV